MLNRHDQQPALLEISELIHISGELMLVKGTANNCLWTWLLATMPCRISMKWAAPPPDLVVFGGRIELGEYPLLGCRRPGPFHACAIKRSMPII
jgi:hypothetical protein